MLHVGLYLINSLIPIVFVFSGSLVVAVICVNQFPRGRHAMGSPKLNISLQESRTGDPLTVEPTVAYNEAANFSDVLSQDGHYEFDIDDLKGQLGIDHIIQSLNALKEKLLGLSGVPSLPESENTVGKSNSVDSLTSCDAVFDPTAVISTEQTSASTSGA